MLVRKRTTAILASGLLLLGAAACEGEDVSPAGELDTGAEGTDNGVQPDGTGPESYDDPVLGDEDEGEQPEG